MPEKFIKPSFLDIKDYTLTTQQLIYIMSKFLHTVSDFTGESFKGVVNYCDNLMFTCSKSRTLWYKVFGKEVLGLNVCVQDTYDKAYYKFRLKTADGKTSFTSPKSVTFNNDEQAIVKKVCRYKQQFNGRGEDPKCASVAKDLFGGGSNDFAVLIQHLNKSFQHAYKKITHYKRVVSLDDTSKKTFYVHTGQPHQVVTSIKGEKETTNTCNPGDFVITGPKGEKYVIPPHKLPNSYNLIDNVLVTRQQPRLVAHISRKILKELRLPAAITFTASWGEDMILKAGDYLVKEDEHNFYRIESSVFKTTYALQQ